jgi:hypothetical protein
MGESVTLSGAGTGLDAQAAAYAGATPFNTSINPSSEALQVLTQLTDGGLSRDQVSALSAAVAQVDAGIENPTLKQQVLNEVSGMGLYFKNTDPEGFPRWPVMTALRAYGLNLSVPQGQGEQEVARRVRQVLSDVAQQTRGVNARQAVAAAPQPVVLKVVAASASDDTPVAPLQPQANPTPAPVVTAVDKLV